MSLQVIHGSDQPPTNHVISDRVTKLFRQALLRKGPEAETAMRLCIRRAKREGLDPHQVVVLAGSPASRLSNQNIADNAEATSGSVSGSSMIAAPLMRGVR